MKDCLERIYSDLKSGITVDLTPFAKEEYKEYRDSKEGEQLVTKMTLQMRGKRQPVIMAELYRDKCLIENHWYYLDQLSDLRALLNVWLKK